MPGRLLAPSTKASITDSPRCEHSVETEIAKAILAPRSDRLKALLNPAVEVLSQRRLDADTPSAGPWNRR